MHYCCDSSKHSESALPSQWNKNKKTKQKKQFYEQQRQGCAEINIV